MSTPIDTSSNGQRPPRRGRKSNASKTQGNSSAAPHIPMFYDGSSEPTPPNSQRKGVKHASSNGNGIYQGNPHFQKPLSQQQRNNSQPHRKSPPGTQATPIKSTAYAGPTFHASPAASSLPIPKMFSKSVPETTAVLPPHIVAEESDVAQTDSEEPIPTFTPEPKAREPSPLDFLFNAARQARSSSGHTRTPSLRSGNLSPSEEHIPASGHETPTNRSATMFAMELDGNNGSPNTIGPAFATPYQERMSAYRTRQPSIPNDDSTMDENERLAKTEALKKFLGQQSSPKPVVSSPHSTPSYRPSPQRYHSGPSTPTQAKPAPTAQYQSPGYSSPGNDFPFRDIITQRPPSSKLRQQVSPPYVDVQAPPSGYNSSPSRTPRAVSTKQLEDDLRRVLKLDISS